MGISEGTVPVDQNFFYNEFVSKIVFNPPKMSRVDQEMIHCRAIIKRASIIDIRFTQGDAMVLKRVLASKTPIWTVVGGLLSLHVGFSIFSLSESLYLLVILVLPKSCCHSAKDL